VYSISTAIQFLPSLGYFEADGRSRELHRSNDFTMSSIVSRAPLRACLRAVAPAASASISTAAAASTGLCRTALNVKRHRQCLAPGQRRAVSSTTNDSQQKVR
jgi:hypothetical protein